MDKTTPVEEFFAERTKEAEGRAARDLELWQKWDQSGRTPAALAPLMQRYEPLFGRKLKDWKAPAVSPSAFKAELKKQFIRAAESFDPNRGVAFNTHVQARLPKAMRFNTRYQNVGYIPEGQAGHIGKIQVAESELFEELGRKPTPAEIGAHVGLSPGKVQGILESVRRDVPASAFETDPVAFGAAREEDVLRLVARRPEDYLTADEARVFRHIYGSDGTPRLTSTKDLATALGTSESRISRLKTRIVQKLRESL
jgi:DNA-directed RNA polymerase specialized sigma subunit